MTQSLRPNNIQFPIILFIQIITPTSTISYSTPNKFSLGFNKTGHNHRMNINIFQKKSTN